MLLAEVCFASVSFNLCLQIWRILSVGGYMNSATKVKDLSVLNLIGIFSLFCINAEFTIMTPSIGALAAHFSDTPFTTIMLANTITGVVSVPISIVAGIIVRRVGYRPLAILGTLIMTVGGAYPFLMPDILTYWPIVISRIIVGVGYGLIFPLAGALVITFFSGKKRSTYLGIGYTITFLFAVIFSLVAGYTTAIAWNYSFLTYLVTLIPLTVVILFLPEGKNIEKDEPEKQASTGSKKEVIPKAVFGYVFFFGVLMWMMLVVVQLLAAIILGEREIGDAIAAGWVTSSFSVGCMVAGLAFSTVLGLLRNRIIPVCSLIVAAGLALVFFANSAVMYAAGGFLVAYGGSTIFTSAQNAVGNISPTSRVPLTNGLMMAAMNLATFFASYYIASVQGLLPNLGTAAPMLIGVVFFIISAVVMFFLPFKALVKGIEKK